VTATPGQAAGGVDPSSIAYRVHAHAFNTLTRMLAADDRFVPLSVREAVAGAIVEVIEPLIRADERALAAQEPHAAPGESPEQAWERRTQAAGTAPRALRAELETQVRSWLHNAEDAYGDDDSAAAAKDAFGQCAAELITRSRSPRPSWPPRSPNHAATARRCR
jgi:hypothetical protein